MTPSLQVDLAPGQKNGLVLRNPVMPASGTFGYGREFADILDLNLLGAIVVKGISLAPVAGNPTPRLTETPAGLLNAIGLQNPGCDAFIQDYLPFLRQFQTPLIVNIWGRTTEEAPPRRGRLLDPLREGSERRHARGLARMSGVGDVVVETHVSEVRRRDELLEQASDGHVRTTGRQRSGLGHALSLFMARSWRATPAAHAHRGGSR